MKKVWLIIIVAIGLSACNFHRKNVWTKTYEQDAYNQSYQATANMMKDTAQRKQFCLYMVKKLKEALPYGIESVSSDSLQKISLKIGDEYIQTQNTDKLQMTVPWSPISEAAFRKSVLKQQYMAGKDIKTRNKFCNCLLVELKKVYPDSFKIPVPDSVYVKVISKCKIQ